MSSRLWVTSLIALGLFGVFAVVWITPSVGQSDESKSKKVKGDKPPRDEDAPKEEKRSKYTPEEKLQREAEKALKRQEAERNKMTQETRTPARAENSRAPDGRRMDAPREKAPAKTPEPKLPPWFAQLDRHHDGQVALYQWLAAGGTRDDFVRMDRNRDGFLTREEVVQFQSAREHAHDLPTVPEYVRIDHDAPNELLEDEDRYRAPDREFSAMRNLRLILSYDGSDFHGWQTQPGFRTVQETLETALHQLTNESVRVNVSGRTDTGVHAVGQVVNFHANTTLAADVLVRAINAHLPDDVVVKDAAEVPDSFDANRDAKRKLYRYVAHDGAVPNLFLRRYCYHVKRRLDVAAMARAAVPLRGRHDFHSFETEWPNRLTSVRTITHLTVNRAGDFLWIDVEADGFLYNMVRAIAGTLLNVGRGYWPETKVAEILTAEDRREAGPTAPAQGLFLMRVCYE